MMGAIAIAPLIGAAAMVPASSSALSARVAAFRARTARMNSGDFSKAEWDRWWLDQEALIAEVERLPNTLPNAGLRAQMWKNANIGDEGIQDMLDACSGRSGELAAQIIHLLAGAN